MRVVAGALALVLAACGARAGSQPTPTLHVDDVEAEISGVRVVARERAGSGHLAAALFVRVSAEPPSLATTAALVVEARSGGRLVARATADGITLRTTATSAALAPVVDALAEALATRDASSEEVASALTRLRARRAGRASDDRSRAARLAIAAMFGAELDALGTTRDDERLTSEAVSELLRTCFGAERALVAVVGDVRANAVESAVERAFAAAPHVDPRETSASALAQDVRVEVSDDDVIAVAHAVPDLEAAERARGWIEWADPSALVSAFPLRGAAVVVAVRDGGPDDAVALVSRVRRATFLHERSGHGIAPDVEGELLALGDAWLARRDAPPGDGMGVGVVVAGDRGDGAPGSDDARANAVRMRTLGAVALPSPAASGSLDETSADARLESGLRVRVRRVAGGTLAVAIAFEGGAVLDPRAEHGRAALLAALLAQSCEPDAEVTWVDARSIGLVVSGDPSTLERTTARAVDCARRVAQEAAHADGLRAEAIALLDESTRARAWAATAIAPATPGLVAPRGSAVGLAAASGLDAASRALLAPARATIVVIGDVEPARALEITRALAGELATSTEVAPPETRVGAVATGDVFLADPVVVAPEVIVTLRSDVGESTAAARATARALADALSAEGAAVQFWLGDAALGSSFVAVGVRGEDALLDALPARMAARFAILDPVPGLTEAVETEQRRRALASPMEIARSMATSEAEPTDPLAVVRGLLAAAPRYVMLRPSAGPMRPPRRR